MAGDKWSIEAQMHGKTKQLSNRNNHHTIPRKHYGKITTNDFGKPVSAQYDVTDENDNHYPSDMNTYGKPGGLIRTHG